MKKSRKKYRYVLTGLVDENEPISNFRLIAGNNIGSKYSGATAIRVQIPDDLLLTKYSCDLYATTEDNRTINELGYDVIAYNENTNKWVVLNELKGEQPHEMNVVVRYPEFRPERWSDIDPKAIKAIYPEWKE